MVCLDSRIIFSFDQIIKLRKFLPITKWQQKQTCCDLSPYSCFSRYGAQSLKISQFLHQIVALYSDPTAPVRDAAASTLVEIYRHIGDRVRQDLQKKHNIPPAK